MRAFLLTCPRRHQHSKAITRQAKGAGEASPVPLRLSERTTRHRVIPVSPGKGTGSLARTRPWSSVAALRLNRGPKARARGAGRLILRKDKRQERFNVTRVCHSSWVRRVSVVLNQTRQAAINSQVNSDRFAGNGCAAVTWVGNPRGGVVGWKGSGNPPCFF